MGRRFLEEGDKTSTSAANPESNLLTRPARILKTEPVIKARKLHKIYGKGSTSVEALRGIDIDISKGEFTAIMGPSGSGKSTLMHCLAGLDTFSSGKVQLAGIELAGLSQRKLTKLRREKIGFIFQAFNLLPTLSAAENIKLPAGAARIKIDPERFAMLTEAVGISDRLQHRPAELSGGQQQRVACVRALITNPAVIFADEPTGNLDSKSSKQILTFLHQAAHEFQQTVVMVTHDPTAAAWADRVLFLVDGKIVKELSNPETDSVLDVLREIGAGEC